MLNEKKKTQQDRRDKTNYPPSSSFDDRGVSTVGGIKTPQYLLVDVEVVGDYYHTTRQRPPKKTIPYYRLIRKLRDRGYFFYQISNIFNQHKLKPNRTDRFTPQNIHGSYKKMKIRESKMKERQLPIVKKIEYIY